jgi:hypothetical protein
LIATGCSSTTGRDGAAPVASSSNLGRVPIPTTPSDPPPLAASVKHPQLLAMGAGVRAVLAGGAALPPVSALVTALGPDFRLPSRSSGGPPDKAVGTITITARVSHGSLTLGREDFTSRDERGRRVELTPSGPSSAVVGAGDSAKLTLTGVFTAGAAQITWRRGGHVIAIWDFTVELD